MQYIQDSISFQILLSSSGIKKKIKGKQTIFGFIYTRATFTNTDVKFQIPIESIVVLSSLWSSATPHVGEKVAGGSGGAGYDQGISVVRGLLVPQCLQLPVYVHITYGSRELELLVTCKKGSTVEHVIKHK